VAQSSATLLFLALLIPAVVACDTASENEGCTDPVHPGQPGKDPSNCARSNFQDGDLRSRDVTGIVRRGEDGVPSASVHVSQTQGSPGDDIATSGDALTDTIGFFRVPGSITTLYDLSFVLPNGPGGRKDVMILRGESARYTEPQLEVPGRTLPRSWSGHVDVRFDAPIKDGDAVLFLAQGDGVWGVTGDINAGLEVHTVKYVQSANIRAIEYDPAQGLISANAYGKSDVISDAGSPKAIIFHLDPITKSVVPQLSYQVPPGFTPGAVDIRVGLNRTSDALIASIPFDTNMTLPIIPDNAYTYQLKAKDVSGAIIDSGETGFDILKPATISLPLPPTILAPVNTTIVAGDVLSVVGAGVLEHVFEPTTPGNPSLRIIVKGTDTTLPDLASLGVTNSTGVYSWSVRSFPTMTAVENIFGADARRYKAVGTSPPRSVLLR
jgi:hypothetical protein